MLDRAIIRTVAFVGVTFGSSPCIEDAQAATKRPLSTCAVTPDLRLEAATSVAMTRTASEPCRLCMDCP